MEISVTFSEMGKPKTLDEITPHPAHLAVLYYKMKKDGRVELTTDYDPAGFTTYKLRVMEVYE